MKRLLTLLLLVSVGMAIVVPNIEVSTISGVDRVYPEETGSFQVIITNNENVSAPVYLLIAGSRTSWLQNYKYYHNVNADSYVSVPIEVTPIFDARAGSYDFTIRAKAKLDGEWLDLKPSTFTLSVLESSVITPTVPRLAGEPMIEIHSDLLAYEPDSTVTLSIRITELETVYKELRASIKLLDTSGNPIYQYLMPISSQEEPIVLMHSFAFDSRTPPGDYVLMVDLVSERGKLGSGSIPVEVTSVSDVEVKKDVQIGVLKKTLLMTATNRGNVPASGAIEETIRWYEKWLISASPAPDAITESGDTLLLKWFYDDLQPDQDTQRVVFSISYVPVLLLFVVIILLLVVAWQGVKTVSIRKEVVRQALGNTLKVKLSLTIRNLTDQTMKNVVVIDQLPIMAHPTHYETIKASAVKKKKDGVQVEWDIGDLKPLEERVIQYEFATKFGIVGTIDLRSAEVRFTLPDGRRQSMKSNETVCGVAE